MSTTEIIISIATSSLISSLLTSYINWKIHDSNYKKDYYKKLINKRLDAYESLDLVTNLLSNKVDTENGIIHGFLCNDYLFNHCIKKLNTAIGKSTWLDDITSHKLTEFNIFLHNEITGEINDSEPEYIQTKKYTYLAIKHYRKIEEFKSTLDYFLKNELKNLYQMDKFFDDKRGGNKTYPIKSHKINNE
ncbi:hypothetical protein Q4553_06415 [Tenacibaculum soleae]|uniref:hypothetical protein n=1 Tax=Tenacibaculum soleae TaxID=447689 RepID=UPI0026E492B0|nr:hypothetical protein [Tenacibaculum soleae]MDO6744201.1 hypothetical protein [Tenacibaculum soleae]